MTDQPEQPRDEIGAAQQEMMNAFYAIVGAPDDADVATFADKAVRELDALLTSGRGSAT